MHNVIEDFRNYDFESETFVYDSESETSEYG